MTPVLEGRCVHTVTGVHQVSVPFLCHLFLLPYPGPTVLRYIYSGCLAGLVGSGGRRGMGRKSADLTGLPADEALVSSVTAARYWGVSRQFVSKLIKNGQVPAVRIGSSVLIPRSVVLSVAKNGLPTAASSSAPEPVSSRRLTLLEHLALSYAAI